MIPERTITDGEKWVFLEILSRANSLELQELLQMVEREIRLSNAAIEEGFEEEAQE